MQAVLGPLCAFLTSVTWVAGSGAYAQLSRRYVPGTVNFNRALVAFPLYLLFIAFDHAAIATNVAELGGSGLAERLGWLGASITASYVVGDALFLYAALSLGFTAAQAITATYPIWATLAAVALKGEVVTLSRGTGLCLAIVGVIIVVSSTRSGDHTPPPDEQAWLRKKSVGVAIAFAASLSWGVNSYAVAHGGHGVHVALGGALRMGLALALTPLAARLQGAKRLFLDAIDYKRFLPVLVLEAFVGSAFYFYGLSHTPVAVGAALSSLAPVLSVPIAVTLGWEKFSWAKTLGVCVVVGGVVLLLA